MASLMFRPERQKCLKIMGVNAAARHCSCKFRMDRNLTSSQRHLTTFPNGAPRVRRVCEGLSVMDTKHGRYLRWDALHQQTTSLDLVFLRDICSCSKCVNQSSGQKQFDTAAIPLDIDIRKATRSDKGAIRIEWANDLPGFEQHTTVLCPEVWHQNSSRSARRKASFEDKETLVWTGEHLSTREADIWFEYDEYMSSEKTLSLLIQSLTKYGLAFIRNVPEHASSVISLSHRIGPLQNTFYGSTWDVKARPSARNVAYTANNLGFHMDLLYMKDPPYLQFLHCLKQSVEGGESLFSDTLNAVYGIQQDRPDIAPSMWRCPVTYRYKNAGKFYQFIRPMLEGPEMADVDKTFQDWTTTRQNSTNHTALTDVGLAWGRHFHAVNWSPPFQGPFINDIGEYMPKSDRLSTFRQFIQVNKIFQKIIESPENVYETKLNAGDCVVFDNRRVVHARKAFKNMSGERWLKGSYIDSNSFNSRRRALEAGFYDKCPSALLD